MKKGIFIRLFKTYAIILLIVFLAIITTVSGFVNSYMIKRHTDTVMSISHTLEYWTGTYQIEQNNARARTAYMRTLKSWSDFVKADITVTNLYGEIAGTTSEVESVSKSDINRIARGGVIRRYGKFGMKHKGLQYIIGVPIRYQGTIVAAMFFTTPLKLLMKTTFEVILIVTMCAALSAILALVLIYFQARRISKPIQEINNAARNVASGNFSGRAAVQSDDEIGQLASSFNFMADSIEDLEKMRQGFISDVSHELRTPMTSISGFAQSILDGTIPKADEEKYLKIIVDESKRLTKLVNDMLDMSKMSAKEYQLTIETFDLNELVRLCIISLENKITDHSLDLDVDFETDELLVMADRDSIQRVILNLMDNAVKFSYKNTVIKIKTWTKNKKAYFSVGNFGMGIDNKDLSSIFNRFYKTDKSRTKERQGAGLGLSLCRNIIGLHKQNIWVESNPAKEGSALKYTQFTFTLEKS